MQDLLSGPLFSAVQETVQHVTTDCPGSSTSGTSGSCDLARMESVRDSVFCCGSDSGQGGIALGSSATTMYCLLLRQLMSQPVLTLDTNMERQGEPGLKKSEQLRLCILRSTLISLM